MRVQDHRDDDDQVSQENGQDCLRPIHSAADERRSQHVSRNTGGHRDPEGREAPDAPCSFCLRDRREVFVVEGRMLDFDRDIDIWREWSGSRHLEASERRNQRNDSFTRSGRIIWFPVNSRKSTAYPASFNLRTICSVRLIDRTWSWTPCAMKRGGFPKRTGAETNSGE